MKKDKQSKKVKLKKKNWKKKVLKEKKNDKKKKKIAYEKRFINR